MYPDIEAKKCLREFYSGVHNALEKVHDELKLVHMDIHLNNICFNDGFQPILIDFDRALPNTLRRIPVVHLPALSFSQTTSVITYYTHIYKINVQLCDVLMKLSPHYMKGSVSDVCLVRVICSNVFVQHLVVKKRIIV